MLTPEAQSIDVEAIVREYRHEGVVRVGRLLDERAAEALRQRADDIMLARVHYDGMFFQRDAESGRYDDLEFGKGWQGPSLEYRKLEKLEKDPLYRAWIGNPAFERIARALIEGPIALYRAVLFCKSKRGGTALPWHQDGGRFWGLDRDPTLQIWTALDDVTIEAGCLEVVPGTHARGLVTPEGGVIPDGPLRDANAEARAVRIPAHAGEVLLVHNHLWHRSGVNTSGAPRRALSVCYLSAATRCLRKKRAPRQFVPIFG